MFMLNFTSFVCCTPGPVCFFVKEMNCDFPEDIAPAQVFMGYFPSEKKLLLTSV